MKRIQLNGLRKYIVSNKREIWLKEKSNSKEDTEYQITGGVFQRLILYPSTKGSSITKFSELEPAEVKVLVWNYRICRQSVVTVKVNKKLAQIRR